MPLSSGTLLGPYEVLTPIGAGGMGEVYKARDTRLDRIVALKVSKQEFSQRFEREARAIAALNHSHICQLYDVGPNYLVMELVEGQPLKGPLPVDTALTYAGQILEALEAAHRKGIVHRDLKPANIMVTRQGVKLLDFGLAKPATSLKETDATVTSALSNQGQIIGTLQYMSPEQLQGKDADARSDLFAFGCVLYEMLTGKRAFEGSSAASVIAAIMERDTPSVASVAPAALDRIVRRSLAKDPEDRWQAARDLRSALELAMEPAAASAPPVRATKLPWIVAAACGILALIVLWAPWRHPTIDERAVHFQIGPPPGAQFILGVGGGSAISPDGRTIAVVAVAAGLPKLWIRSLDSLTARELPGTEGAAFPFWSPDSRSLGFFAGGKLKRIDLGSGHPVVLADAPTPRGGAWSLDGTIIFAPGSIGGFQRVPASGGTPTALTTVDSTTGENGHRWPQFLPGGRQFLYFSQNSTANRSAIFLTSLDHPSEKTRLVESSNGACYVPPQGPRPGYLIWFRQGALIAQPFDLQRERLTGEALPIPDGENAMLVSGAYYAGFSASDDGTILFSSGIERFMLTWFSREGKALATVGQPDSYGAMRISPDGTRVGVSVATSSGSRDVTTIDFARGVQTRLTSGMMTLMPTWSADSRRIDFNPINSKSILERNASGAGQQETVFESSGPIYIDDWSADGRHLLYEEIDRAGHMTLWLLPRNPTTSAAGKPVLYLKSASNQLNAQFSPDGKWISYSSDESGSLEVYVQSVPAGEQKWQVSSGGGDFARWRRDGKELFYRALDGRLMAVSIRAGGRGLEFSSAVPLFRLIPPIGPHAYVYDLAPDGQRILSLAPATESNTATLTVLMSWRRGGN